MKDKELKLAANLERLMTLKNLTLTAAARKVRMSKSTLHGYMNGVMPRSLLTLLKLARLLDVSLDDLLFDYEEDRTFLMKVRGNENNKIALEELFKGRVEIVIKQISD